MVLLYRDDKDSFTRLEVSEFGNHAVPCAQRRLINMKKKVLVLFAALALLLSFVPSLQSSANAELVKGTRLRVVASEGTDPGSFKVQYGPESFFKQGKLFDVTKDAASDRGIEYISPGQGPLRDNLYIIAGDHYKITSVKVTQGFMEYYSIGSFIFSSVALYIYDQDLVVLTGEELDYRDGNNKIYIEKGGAKERNIPEYYTGPGYFGDKVTDSSGRGTWFFTLSVTTELANSGAVTIEETKMGTAAANYTLNYGSGVMQGTAEKLTAEFNAALKAGTITAGTRVEITYDPKLVGGVLVRKGDSGYEDPAEPEWTTGKNSLSFTLDKIDRTIRFIYNAPPGSVRFETGTDPFGFTTKIEMTHGKEIFEGSIDEVNARIEEEISSGLLFPGDVLNFTISNPQDVRAVRIAEVPINFITHREGDPGPFGNNVLQGRAFSVQLSTEKAFRIRIDFRSTPGRLYIQETKQNEGTFQVEVSTEVFHSVYFEGTAQETMKYLDTAISIGEAKVGSKITLQFPEDIENVKMGVGDAQSTDITTKLQIRKYSYTEGTDDVTFFVKYKGSGSEIIINPAQPQKPDETVPVPTISIEPFGPTPTPVTSVNGTPADAPINNGNGKIVHSLGPSKQTGDLTGLEIKTPTGVVFDPGFSIETTEETDYSKKIFNDFAAILNSGNKTISDCFPSYIVQQIKGKLPASTNVDALFINEFMPLNVRNFNGKYGDLTINFRFPTYYREGQTVVPVIGSKVGNSTQWVVLQGTPTKDGSVDVRFPRLDMVLLSNVEGVLMILSEP